MTRTGHLKRSLALIGTLLVGVGLALAAPAAAQAATTNYTLDCVTSNADIGYYSQTFYVAPGNTVTFALTGYTSVYDYDTSTDIAALNPAGDSYVVNAGQYYSFYDPTNACAEYFDVYVEEAAPETVPSGSLLFTQDISIPVGAPQVTVTDNSSGNGEHFFAGNPDCGVSVDIHGSHVYGTLDITVLASGTFTFRGMITSPAGYYIGIEPYDPIGDPFLAVYSHFDPANPDTGIVGCNDDLNDVGASNDAEYLSDGTIIEGHEPFFTSALTPGHYTLVLMTWEDLSTTDLGSGYAPWEESDFEIGTKTTTFQLWGPVGGLALGTLALAETGADASAGWYGVAALAAGFVVILLSRRVPHRRTR